MATHTEDIFSPQPGDIIFLQNPIIYPDGTYGPLIKIFKDNLFFTSSKIPMTLSNQVMHKFKRGEKILRLFKLYQNWEFVSCKTHELYVYYPDYIKGHPWLKINTITNLDHLNCKSIPELPNVRHFTHLPPSKLFSLVSEAEFLPRPQNIIIHALHGENTEEAIEASEFLEMCERCKKSKQTTLNSNLNAKYPVPPPPNDINAVNAMLNENCHYCRLPWATQFRLENWSDTFKPREGDYLVRYEIDAQYSLFSKKTRLQVEFFGYASHEKTWKYLGMDVADCGPTVRMHDIVYYPQPGDIIISKNLNWSARWDPHRQVGGYSMFYKDNEYFGEIEGGKDLWPTEVERTRGKIQKMPTDSWLVRLGCFDEYWEFHHNDQADVFALHQNGKTMLLHYSIDFPCKTHTPRYRYNFDEKEPLLMSEVEIEPNHWDLIVRGIHKVHEDPIKSRDWTPDPHHWMKDPLLWGRDNPPRFDKEVELYTYWSGFSFEDKDLLLRVGFGQTDESQLQSFHNDFFYPEVDEQVGDFSPYGHTNPSIPFFHTNASLDLYQVRVEEDEEQPKFLFLGRDQYSFPDEYVAEPSIDHPKEDSKEDSSHYEKHLSEKHKKNSNGVVTKDGENGGNVKKNKKTNIAKQEGEAGGRNSKTANNSEVAHEVKLSVGEVKVPVGDEVAPP